MLLKRFFVFYFLLIFGSVFSQKYYPKLKHVLFSREILGKNLEPLKTELAKVSDKLFYDGFQFSTSPDGNSTFLGTSLIPLKNNNFNFLGTGVDIVFNRTNPLKRSPIPLTYQELFFQETVTSYNEKKIELSKMKSEAYFPNSSGVSLIFPHHYIELLTGEKPETNDIFAFEVSQIQSELAHAEDRGYAEIIFYGKFTKPVIVYGSKPAKEIEKIIFLIISGTKSLKVPYTRERNGETDRFESILFEEMLKNKSKNIIKVYN